MPVLAALHNSLLQRLEFPEILGTALNMSSKTTNSKHRHLVQHDTTKFIGFTARFGATQHPETNVIPRSPLPRQSQKRRIRWPLKPLGTRDTNPRTASRPTEPM
jgi:hypothetical protein